ncbi:MULTISPECIES: hypothetical protein [unclassified Devosia]|uniref:hypothetical protein n=1 Tax=unclassified Devosia TaxID=196773 RepID=UPI001AC4BB79|nr:MULTISPECIES: hypothetical protein [unclassified Devosia]MBN9306669.1 hypothetical protein [Devosia sp.]
MAAFVEARRERVQNGDDLRIGGMGELQIHLHRLGATPACVRRAIGQQRVLRRLKLRDPDRSRRRYPDDSNCGQSLLQIHR